jgi:predicted  nucleic acid-binding Zn-ribbon protein
LENKLRQLYALQLIDANLDELLEMKGDLPQETIAAEQKVAQLNAQLATLDDLVKTTYAARDKADSDIITLKQKTEKYKEQQLHVRNNREYDALTKEIDYTVETVARLEKEMETLEGKAEIAKKDIETLRTELEAAMTLLDEKRAALAEVSKETEAEELKYQHEREKLIKRIDKDYLDTYERIRKAKKGKAVVPVKRGSCGGCFNRVPPQMLLELRQNSKIYTCERCGRIIVSDEIVETVGTVA